MYSDFFYCDRNSNITLVLILINLEYIFLYKLILIKFENNMIYFIKY